jgi:anaerobic magnesium-protoporphyrin IX monomethyl ester cyclase
MKVLLLSPPYLKNYMRNARCDFVSLSGSQWYPLHLGYCGSWLEKCGHRIKLIDAPVYKLSKSDVIKEIADFRPDWVVLYSGRLSEESDIAFAEKIQSESCNVVLVGPYASINPEATLSKCSKVAYLIRGEFEYPVQELIEGKAAISIKNLVFRSDSEIIQNPMRAYLTGEQLDEIPFVSTFFSKQVDLWRYKTVSEPYPYLDLLTGRGCAWGKCTFCLWVHTYIKGPIYNFRSVKNVIDELDYIKRELPSVKSVMIQDDTLTEDRATELCEAKLSSGNTLKWSCYARANLKSETLCLMKRAGCLNLHVGFESGSNEVLRQIRKGITVERMITFVKDAKRAKLRIHGDFAVGFPGETKESIRQTVNFALVLRPYTAQFQLMIPFKGTPYYEILASRRCLTEDGIPNFPNLSAEEMEDKVKGAYWSYYLNYVYFFQLLMHPYSMFLSRIKTHAEALFSLFFRRYIR